jgi:hypothetical protein
VKLSTDFVPLKSTISDDFQRPPTVLRTTFGRITRTIQNKIYTLAIRILKIIFMVDANNKMATARICSLFVGLKTMAELREYEINLLVQQIRHVR